MTARGKVDHQPETTTPAGLRRARERLGRFREEYFAVCASNEEAAGAGDSSVWHDNFAHEENQRQMYRLAHRIRELEQCIDRIRVVPAWAEAPETVRLGVRVRLVFDDGQEMTCFIAGWQDGDPQRGRISYESPLARGLLGAREGDVRTVRVGPRRREVEILEILPAPPEEVNP